jgi:hypothetical protein
MTFVSVVNTPTVTEESLFAMLASRVGSLRASLSSFGVILYLSSYLRNVEFSRSCCARRKLTHTGINLGRDRGNRDQTKEHEHPEQPEIGEEDRNHPREAPTSEELDHGPSASARNTANTMSSSTPRIR